MIRKVDEHSHLAVDVDLVDKITEDVTTPFGELKKAKVDEDVQFMKPKTNKHDEEFLNQIAYLRSVIQLVSNQLNSRDSGDNGKSFSSPKKRRNQQL